MDYAVDPNDPHMLIHLGMALCRAGKYEEATQHLRRLLDMNLGAVDGMRWVYDVLIDLAHMAGNRDEAARLTEQGLALFPGDEYLLLVRAKEFCAQKDYSAAVEVLKRVMHDSPSRKMLYATAGNVKTKLAPLMLGTVYGLQLSYAEAESTLQAVVAAFPDDCEALFNLGLVYLEPYRRPELVALIERIFKTPGGSMHAGLLSAMCHLRHGDLGVASQIIDQLIGANPQQARPRMLRAECLSRSNAPLEDQLRAHHDVLRVSPGNVVALNGIQMVEQVRRQAAFSTSPSASTSGVVMPGIPVG
jgi:tetratricopeptide (TPR) repeat protein